MCPACNKIPVKVSDDISRASHWKNKEMSEEMTMRKDSPNSEYGRKPTTEKTDAIAELSLAESQNN